MPRIAICGVVTLEMTGPVPYYPWGKETALELKDKITGVIEKLGLENDAVIEIIPSIVYSCDGENKLMPYLQVCSTVKDERTRIVSELLQADIGIDMEEIAIEFFTEAIGGTGQRNIADIADTSDWEVGDIGVFKGFEPAKENMFIVRKAAKRGLKISHNVESKPEKTDAGDGYITETCLVYIDDVEKASIN